VKTPAGRVFPGIAAAAGAVLMLEIGLTRIFSFTIWYHFAYLTISVALLGYGAAGSVLAAWPHLKERSGFLSWMALAAQAATLLCLVVIDQLVLDPLAIGSDASQLARMLVYYVAVALPFFAGGFLVALPLQAWPASVSRLYFWDLVGAGLACGSIVPLIWWLGTPIATGLSAALLAIAAWAYAEPELRTRQTVAAVALAAAVLGFAAVADFAPAPTKFVSQHLRAEGAALAFSRWTPVNRVDVVTFDPPATTGSYGDWGVSQTWKGRPPGYYVIGHDGDSIAVMYEWDGRRESIEFLEHHVLRVPYLVVDDPEVVLIGLGGGADVLNGLANGARSITGVEINPMTVHAGKVLFRDFNGDLLNRPEVRVEVAEGRSFLRSSPDRYDLIEINSVDTLSALSTGAYVLSESYLYTSDAIQDYLDHLRPGGVFAMAVGDVGSPDRPARHTLRLATTVRRALEERGISNPERHVMIVGAGGVLRLTHTLVKNEPFTAEEVARVERFVDQEGFIFWHRPDRPSKSFASGLLTLEQPKLESFLDDYHLNLAASTDDSPFFFNFYKWRTLFDPATYQTLDYDRTQATGQIVLAIMLVQSVLFGGLAILLPLRRLPMSGGGSGRERLGLLGYFTALGAGFILLEISFIQRFVLFLGYPTYSLTVVMLSLLVSAGVGSLYTERVRDDFTKGLAPRLGLLVVLVAFYLLGMPSIFDALLGAPLAVRILLSIALIVPLGLVLGGFFPLGIRLAERANPRLVPWAWAVNGCATVVGTLVAVIAGMTWSFSVVAVLALLIYAAGVLGLLAAERGIGLRAG